MLDDVLSRIGVGLIRTARLACAAVVAHSLIAKAEFADPGTLSDGEDPNDPRPRHEELIAARAFTYADALLDEWVNGLKPSEVDPAIRPAAREKMYAPTLAAMHPAAPVPAQAPT